MSFPGLTRALIEILISTAILLVIVVMVSMVFQQQSAAFQSGTDRVKGQASLRNAMGMIVRDLSLAVTNSYGISDSDIKFTTSGISFLASTGTAGYDADGNEEKGATAVQLISYDSAGKRIVKGTIVADNDGSFKLKKVSNESQHTATPSNPINVKYTIEGNSRFPTYVTINASYTGSSSASSVTGESAGPDGNWNRTSDNIYVGGKK